MTKREPLVLNCDPSQGETSAITVLDWVLIVLVPATLVVLVVVILTTFGGFFPPNFGNWDIFISARI